MGIKFGLVIAALVLEILAGVSAFAPPSTPPWHWRLLPLGLACYFASILL